MSPCNALERFISEQNDSPAAAAPPMPVITSGAMESFFCPNPIAVNHPTVNSNARELTVARFGRIYKRKAISTTLVYKPPACAAGFRFCKICNDILPEEAFYTHIKRYVCRKHHYQRVRSSFLKRAHGPDGKAVVNAENAWDELITLRQLFGFSSAEYDRHDIMDLVTKTNIPLSVQPRAVPIDPTKPMRPRNVAIVRRCDMCLAQKVYSLTCSISAYIIFVQACNLLPKKADAAAPWDPFQDPDYVRQDLDVVPYLQAEQLQVCERPVVDAMSDALNT